MATAVTSEGMKDLVCRQCGDGFSVPRSRGQYPRRCVECRDLPAPPTPGSLERLARAAEERERRERERQAERERRAEERRIEAEERRAERERERERERLERQREQSAERDRRERERKAEQMRTERNKRRLRPLWDSDRQVVLLNETLEASRRAGDLEPINDRHALAHQVRQVARAEGTDGLRDAYLDLAAAALRAASNVPTAGMREPDPAEHLAEAA